MIEITLQSTERLQRLVFDDMQLAELMAEKECESIRWNIDLSTFVGSFAADPIRRRIPLDHEPIEDELADLLLDAVR